MDYICYYGRCFYLKDFGFSELNNSFENMNSLPQDSRDLVNNLIKIHIIQLFLLSNDKI